MSDAKQPHSHVPFGADGSGFYSDNTIGCYNVVKATLPMTMEAMKEVPFQANGKAFTIADYGTADGGTSMYLLHDCIEWLKERYGETQEVQVLYEDQPVNDFKSLFMRIQGLIPGPPSYLKDFSGVFVAAVGTTFYSQCVPSGSVQLGFSATAFHWLSERPCSLPDAIHHTCSRSPEHKAQFAAQAAKDWQHILLRRSAELAPGGQMVIACFCVDKDGQHLGKSQYLKQSMYEVMTSCWQEMVAEGKVTQEEFEATLFNNYYRTEAEFAAPIRDPSSPVYQAGLRLVSLETKVVRCPYHEKWMAQGEKGDEEAARRHAQWFIPTTRTWSNYTFASALSESRSQAEKAELVDELFRKYEDRVTSAPEEHGMDYVHAYLRLRKEE